ncbi:nitroreductase family protein [Virgibacillus sp. 179-BFC.A HS]|uniref:Nitroreductase family protein n=1 Tax=Tigheibacillus jepli TaxID=3035914 RepID=A0ABU5CG67_9BACI|nr:nitroreductase family protein [Virgibacillus sp. 179-BFC.A HS]MDY0405200.1 nitroreductase family protein [Virgibacillus sp. 179-BFC.A HS]
MNVVEEIRKAAYQIDPIYTQRWSPRSFQDKEIPDDVLRSLFEAARWAPSAANVQPWRFVFARTAEDRERFHAFIDESNVVWCQKAPVLVAVISKTDEERFNGANPTHAFDTGAAWGYLALEATRKGLIAHGMGGFDRQKAKEVLGIPENYFVNVIVAIGYQGEIELLDEAYRDREKPSDRKPQESFVFEGLFDEE